MNPVLTKMPILILQPHNRCNCRCVMCDIWKITEAEGISTSELERHLESIERLGVQWAVFTGGEPLMHADLFRLAALLRARAIRTTILSTGLLLERHSSSIVETIDEIIVSLDGPPEVHDEIRGVKGAFDRLASGVRALHQLSSAYPVAARCTIQAHNAPHLRATVQTARDLGLRSISFLAADLTSTAFNRTDPWPELRQSEVAPELTALEREIEGIVSAYPEDEFIRESPAKLRRIVAHFRAFYGLETHVAPRCNAPWVSAVLEPNGDVRPCFFHNPIGNTAGRTLGEVIKSREAVAFREQLNVADNPVCRRCVCSLFLESGEIETSAQPGAQVAAE